MFRRLLITEPVASHLQRCRLTLPLPGRTTAWIAASATRPLPVHIEKSKASLENPPLPLPDDA